MLVGTSREGALVEHYEQSEFERTTIETLQMCRAALTYTRELVIWRERRLAAADQEMPRGTRRVPSHQWIRGRLPSETLNAV